jgi:hypothetical protein
LKPGVRSASVHHKDRISAPLSAVSDSLVTNTAPVPLHSLHVYLRPNQPLLHPLSHLRFGQRAICIWVAICSTRGLGGGKFSVRESCRWLGAILPEERGRHAPDTLETKDRYADSCALPK